MKRISDTTVQNYSELIDYACSTLKLSREEVKAKYAEYPIRLIEYIEKDVHEKAIEVRFDKSNTSLSIRFEENEICNAVYFFFDDVEEVTNYILHLNDLYDYDFIRSCWILPNNFIQIKKTDDDMCLIVV